MPNEKIPCPECGEKVSEEELVTFGGVCETCFADAAET